MWITLLKQVRILTDVSVMRMIAYIKCVLVRSISIAICVAIGRYRLAHT